VHKGGLQVHSKLNDTWLQFIYRIMQNKALKSTSGNIEDGIEPCVVPEEIPSLRLERRNKGTKDVTHELILPGSVLSTYIYT